MSTFRSRRPEETRPPGSDETVESGSARFIRTRRDRSGGTMNLNLVAMIDVVFLLLMYFLLATNFTLGEELFRVELPQSLGSQEKDPFDLPDQPVIVRVQSVGPRLSEYRISLDLGSQQPESFDALYRLLERWQANPSNPEGILFPDTPIIIRPTASCRWDHAVNVLNACFRARYTNVQFVEPGAE